MLNKKENNNKKNKELNKKKLTMITIMLKAQMDYKF